VLTIAAAAMLVACAPAWADHVLKSEQAVTCEVVVPQAAGTVAAFAGQELANILSEALGAPVPIRSEPSSHATSLILGNHPIARQAGIDVDAIPRDGFVIRSQGDDLFIAGKDDPAASVEREIKTISLMQRKSQFQRGTLHGVYHFLERHVGVRFYFPGPIGTVIPRHASLTLPALDVTVAPDHPLRDTAFSGSLPDGIEGPAANEFKSLHRLRQRLQTQYIPNLHGLRDLDLLRRFGQSNPEYFALLPDGRRQVDAGLTHAGHLCLSSAVREVIYLDAKAYLTGQSAESRDIRNRRGQFAWAAAACQPGYFNLQPQDGYVPCNCADCQKHYRGARYREVDLPATSEFVWGFVCEVARRLKQEQVPGYVTMMAYAPYLHVPREDIPDNVQVMVALTGPWNTRGLEQEVQLVERWNAKLPGRKVWLWNYISKHAEMAMPGIPCITPRAVGTYYKRMSPHIRGAYVGCASDRYLYQCLNTYIATKIFWDDQFDVDAAIEEYHARMFGPAAAPMRQFHDRIEHLWIEKVANNQVMTDLGPTSVPPGAHDLWTEIYSETELQAMDALFDQAQALAASDPDSLKRVVFMRAQLLDPLKQSRQDYIGQLRQLAGLRCQAPLLDERQIIQVDGRDLEPAWTLAQILTLQPMPARTPNTQPVQTNVRLLRDARQLYVWIDAHEPAMGEMLAIQRQADDRGIFKDSTVEIFLNPSGDRRNYYQIAINAAGSVTDQMGTKLGSSQTYDWNWSSEAAVKVSTRDDGWSAEVAIPLARLGPLSEPGFPVNFTRTRALRGKPVTQYTWSPYLVHGFHDPERFGQLNLHSDPQSNLIRNPDFTEPVVGRTMGDWYYHASENNPHDCWRLDADQWVAGGQSLQLVGRTGNERISIKQNLPDLKPNTTYYLSYSIRTDQIVPHHASGGAKVSIWDQKNRYFPTTGPHTGTQPWRTDGVRFTTSSEANQKATSYIALILFEATGAAWFDHVQLTEQTSP
jgi:hypothetical protein